MRRARYDAARQDQRCRHTCTIRRSDERLLNPEPHNWLMNHHDFAAQRYSALEAINKSNVKSMKLLFAVAIGGTAGNEALEATPLVEDGFMYISDHWGAVYKIDVRSGTSGRILWKMDPGQEKLDRNRGVALWGNLVISVTSYDGRLYSGNPDHGQHAYFPNLIMSLRVSVTWSVTMAGPPLCMCQAAYCSM
jgi:alcohol dehydrogenase (cytochrome c)